MTIDTRGIDLIKSFEGFKSYPYLDAVGIPTIGFGTTHYEGGRHVTMEDGDISEDRASEILRHEINDHYGAAVNRYIQVEITQNQFDALTSFAYNLGSGALKSSTLLKRVNQGRNKKAAKEFSKWVHAGGRVLKGLVRRRKSEALLFLS